MTPRLWLTSMSGSPSSDNPVEMIEPLLTSLDGVIWVLNDVSDNSPAARYLESVKSAGRVIHRFFPAGRHHHAMNDTLYTGLIEEGDYVLWTDDLERPMSPFVSRIKTEIGPMMEEADVDVLAYYGKPFLFRYHETLEYRNSPHWSLHGWNGRAIEWSQMEPDEKLVRFNTRPIKRAAEPHHWIGHYIKYWLYPAGCNHAALGIEQYARPSEDHGAAFQRREANRLAFRRDMKRRGYPLTVEGFITMCRAEGQPDADLKAWLNGEKTLSDAYWWLVKGDASRLKDTHRPSDAIPIP
jgi:hypothetical protein